MGNGPDPLDELARQLDFLGRSVLLLAKLADVELRGRLSSEMEEMLDELVEGLADEFGPRPGDL